MQEFANLKMQKIVIGSVGFKQFAHLQSFSSLCLVKVNFLENLIADLRNGGRYGPGSHLVTWKWASLPPSIMVASWLCPSNRGMLHLLMKRVMEIHSELKSSLEKSYRGHFLL